MRDGRISIRWRRVAILFVLAGLVAPAGTVTAGGPPVGPRVAPQVTATAPAADATAVPLNSAIQVRFSEPMNPATVSYTIAPAVPATVSWPTTDILVLTPDPPGLTNCTAYTVQVSGADVDEGLSLVPGGARNPWSFATVCDRPYVTQTVPVDGARNLPPDTPIVVTYSEPMDPIAPSFGLDPSPGSMLTSWDGSRTVLTVTTVLAPGIRYTATASGRDVDGNPLVASFVPNPWRFTVNGPPTITGFTVSRGGCLESGSMVTIVWSMADDTDAAVDLVVRVAYRDGTAWAAVLGPGTGFPSSASYPWTVPIGDLVTRLRIEVNDTAGASASVETPPFRIDSSAPRILSTSPADGAVGVPVRTSAVVLFSEPMDPASTEVAVSITPSPGTSSFQWANGNTSLAIVLDGLLDRTPYRVAINGSARDACGAGHPMAVDAAFGFTTGRVPSVAPDRLRVLSTGDTWAEIAWDPVTTFVTGTSIPTSSTVVYQVFRTDPGTAQGSLVAQTPQTRVRDEGLSSAAGYTYYVIAVVDGESSAGSTPLSVTTQPPVIATPLGWIAIGVPVAVAAALLVVFVRRRRAGRHRERGPGAPLEEVRSVGDGLVRARREPDPSARERLLEDLRVRFVALLPAGAEERERTPASTVYETLARTLAGASAVDPSRGASLLRDHIGPIADQLAKFPSPYRAMRDADAALDALPGLPEFARRALLLEFPRGLEEYLRARVAPLGPGPEGAGRRLSRRSRSETTTAELLRRVDREPAAFVARPDEWPGARSRLQEALALRARLEDLDAEPPSPDRIRGSVAAALTACRGLFRAAPAPKGSARRT